MRVSGQSTFTREKVGDSGVYFVSGKVQVPFLLKYRFHLHRWRVEWSMLHRRRFMFFLVFFGFFCFLVLISFFHGGVWSKSG